MTANDKATDDQNGRDGRGDHQGGDQALDFTRVVRIHGAALYRYARHAASDSAEAWDLLQDAYERGLRSAPAGLSDQQALGWMLVVIRNLRLDSFRNRNRRPEIFPAGPDQLAAAERRAARADPAPPADGPQDQAPVWSQLTRDDLRDAVSRLSRRLREVYQLHAFEGLSYLEIAARLGAPPATVGTRLRRARHKLRAILLPPV